MPGGQLRLDQQIDDRPRVADRAVFAYSFEHLLRISTGIGTFEHADHITPRVECGYCTDDMARVLIVACREPNAATPVLGLTRLALQFVIDAIADDGMMHNRRSAAGHWEDQPTVDDCWGRGLWALGTAAGLAPEAPARARALDAFEHAARQRSPWSRAMAFAALGAADVLAVRPDHPAARALLADAAATIGPISSEPHWPWPEPRLSYANAVLPDALLAAGSHLRRPDLVDAGLELLRWLLARETVAGHLSPTPVGGAGPADLAPAFDQQPIEISTMADACHRAAVVSGDDEWLSGIDMAARWFDGHNDVGAEMYDRESGGGFDGLHASGPNLNQGAESTLAMISALQLKTHVARNLR